ncbi:hypothetical protein CDO43_37365, partial [Pseudomonas aeruginosa]
MRAGREAPVAAAIGGGLGRRVAGGVGQGHRGARPRGGRGAGGGGWGGPQARGAPHAQRGWCPVGG